MFEVVVVGGGTAGCVLVDRLLDEHPDLVVLLLEKGGDEETIPWVHPQSSSYSWNSVKKYLKVFKESGSDNGKQSLQCFVGELLGGSSSVNGGVCVLPCPSDFDRLAQPFASDFYNLGSSDNNDFVANWCEALNDLKLMFQTKNFLDSPPQDADVIVKRHVQLVDALASIGFPFMSSYNAANRDVGIAWLQFLDYSSPLFRENNSKEENDDETAGDKLPRERRAKNRFSTAQLLDRHRDKQLHVKTNCAVSELIIEENVVTGVAVGDSQYRSLSTILCAGTLGSSIILQNSIHTYLKKMTCAVMPGEASEVLLRKNKLTHLKDLLGAVGCNLREHFSVYLRYSRRPLESDWTKCPKCSRDIPKYSADCSKCDSTSLRDGNKEAVMRPRSCMFLKSYPHLQYPDLLVEVYSGKNDYILSLILLDPHSYGSFVSTQDESGGSTLCYNGLTNPFDLLRMERGIFQLDSVMRKAFDGKYCSRTMHLKLDNERGTEELRKFILNNFVSWTHPVGTCAMGRDKYSVVDKDFRVYGLANLMIADCSILATQIQGGTFTTALLIGLLAAKSFRNSLKQSVTVNSAAIPRKKKLQPLLLQVPGCSKRMTNICAGTSHLGNMSKVACNEYLSSAISLGITSFDCAAVYNKGSKAFGSWLSGQSKGLRKYLFLVGKGGHPSSLDGSSRVCRSSIFYDCDKLLRNLGTSYLDCFLLHRDDSKVPVGEIMQWLNELVSGGKTNSIGVSNWTLERVAEANRFARRRGLLPLAILSNYFGPILWEQPPWPGCVQSDPTETVRAMQKFGMVGLCYAPVTSVLGAAALPTSSPQTQQILDQFRSSGQSLAEAAVTNVLSLDAAVTAAVVRCSSTSHLASLATAAANALHKAIHCPPPPPLMKSNNEIVVLNTVNEKYLVHCAPLWLSLFDHLGSASAYRRVHFVLMFEGPSDCSYLSQLRVFIDQLNVKEDIGGTKSARMTVVFTDDIFGNELREHAASQLWPDIALGRLFVGRVVPESVNRVLYLDVDLAAVGDIGELYGVDLKGAVCGAARNDCCRVDYFNSGVLLLDLDKWRAEGYESRLIQAQHRLASRLIFPDQDVLNAVVSGDDVYWLSQRWNFFHPIGRLHCSHRVHCSAPACLGKQMGSIAMNERKLIHAVGNTKMWDKPFSTSFSGANTLYHSYANMERRVKRIIFVVQSTKLTPPTTPPLDLGLAVTQFKHYLVFCHNYLAISLEVLAQVSLESLDFARATLTRPAYTVAASDYDMVARETVSILFDAVDAGLQKEHVIQAFLEYSKQLKAESRNIVWKTRWNREPDIWLTWKICVYSHMFLVSKEGHYLIGECRVLYPQALMSASHDTDVDVIHVHTGKQFRVNAQQLRPLMLLRNQLPPDTDAAAPHLPCVALVKANHLPRVKKK